MIVKINYEMRTLVQELRTKDLIGGQDYVHKSSGGDFPEYYSQSCTGPGAS